MLAKQFINIKLFILIFWIFSCLQIVSYVELKQWFFTICI